MYNRSRFPLKLILFDIDSTLVRVERTVIAALLRDLLAAVDHHAPIEDFDVHGKTDRQILRELRELAGVGGDHDADRDAMERLIIDHWRAHLDATTVELMPGVVPLLEDLSRRDDVALGLLTGNLEEAAWLKLDIHELSHYFRFGAFGSDSERRNDLPPIALQRAADAHGRRFDVASTLIIGDSNRDIECAAAWGIRSLAVATGSLDADALRSHGPDAVVDTLDDRTYLDTFLLD
jgi:phosphoglycolate phosphatase